ncbi:MAG: GNAT family N-acetyltransferase [Bacilli bacterium]|jgi:ribosomal protein S18 acetylase RimI-like enzyme|nr:GNAT family N-acetyltransferase [Bacilli bacterium]
MDIIVKRYEKTLVDDVITFELNLRKEEDFWGWKIDDDYIKDVRRSFDDHSFDESISLLAYVDGKVVGRIDSSMIHSHFDGSVKAYLDWICVLKSYRHRGVAQVLLNSLKGELKARNIDTLIALTANNEEAQRFYKSIPDSKMEDMGIWIDIK